MSQILTKRATASRSKRLGNIRRGLCFAGILAGSLPELSAAEYPLATVEDAVRMVRIQQGVEVRLGDSVVFSPDRLTFAAVLWHGDIQRDTNVHTLVVFSRPTESSPFRGPRTILEWTFPGDPIEQKAAAFEQLRFQPDNRTISFLGRHGRANPQVFAVDVDTRVLRQLTHHATAVRDYALGAKGEVFYSALADSDEELRRRLRFEHDGVFLWDPTLFAVSEGRRMAPLLDPENRRYIRQYFFQRDAEPTLIFDSRENRPAEIVAGGSELARGFSIQAHEEWTLSRYASLTPDRQARFALLYPYLPETPRVGGGPGKNVVMTDKIACPYGLVDLGTGRIERLHPATHPMWGGLPAWAPDGRSVVVYGNFASGEAGSRGERAAQWGEVNLATRRVTLLPIPAGWNVVTFDAQGGSLLFFDKRKGYGRISRNASGKWGTFAALGFPGDLNLRWQPATDGTIAIGVKDTLTAPPELAVANIGARESTALTDLNPELHHRRLGAIEPFTWSHRYGADASGFLIRPLDYRPGVRYPLLVLFDDGTMLVNEKDPYFLDAFLQLNGHAIQMLAARGFMILYTRETPMIFRGNNDGSSEGDRVARHVEAAVAKLDEAGLIDPDRLGISGWSRAAYHVDQVLMKSSLHFAAAARDDGGGMEFFPSFRPYFDEELRKIHTPLLVESHGLGHLEMAVEMPDRLQSMGKAVEILYFQTAPHSLLRPGHRLRSLHTHIDWWCFWLKGEEDPDPAKAGQYARWRQLRRVQEGQTKISHEP